MLATVRLATLHDLPAITEIHNYYVVNTHVTFDVRPYRPEERVMWFHDHSDGKRYQLWVAANSRGEVLGYAGTGRHRAKEAYDTTVEASIGCRPDSVGKGLGRALYGALFGSLVGHDVHRIVAGVAQPNPASNALHAHFGFKVIGTYSQVGGTFGRSWDVLGFERLLGLRAGTNNSRSRLTVRRCARAGSACIGR